MLNLNEEETFWGLEELGMRVYFDLDSVLADFDKGVRELCNMEPLNQIEGPVQNDDAMWRAIRDVDHFYARLELMPGAKELFEFAYGLLGDDCQILSGIPKAKRGITTAGEDKISWSHRMLNPNVTVNIVYKEQKKLFCSGEDCILVDDLAANIVAWEQCGGMGILHRDSETSMRRLRELLMKEQ
ncbi:MAG: hypothetical protein LIO42_07175 [Oscillospiraceae bacterium]|nr:hypothetical protein [Oscillospiraceae bacterium]